MFFVDMLFLIWNTVINKNSKFICIIDIRQSDKLKWKSQVLLLILVVGTSKSKY